MNITTQITKLSPYKTNFFTLTKHFQQQSSILGKNFPKIECLIFSFLNSLIFNLWEEGEECFISYG
jgi:hypothetical protein